MTSAHVTSWIVNLSLGYVSAQSSPGASGGSVRFLRATALANARTLLTGKDGVLVSPVGIEPATNRLFLIV